MGNSNNNQGQISKITYKNGNGRPERKLPENVIEGVEMNASMQPTWKGEGTPPVYHVVVPTQTPGGTHVGPENIAVIARTATGGVISRGNKHREPGTISDRKDDDDPHLIGCLPIGGAFIVPVLLAFSLIIPSCSAPSCSRENGGKTTTTYITNNEDILTDPGNPTHSLGAIANRGQEGQTVRNILAPNAPFFGNQYYDADEQFDRELKSVQGVGDYKASAQIIEEELKKLSGGNLDSNAQLKSLEKIAGAYGKISDQFEERKEAVNSSVNEFIEVTKKVPDNHTKEEIAVMESMGDNYTSQSDHAKANYLYFKHLVNKINDGKVKIDGVNFDAETGTTIIKKTEYYQVIKRSKEKPRGFVETLKSFFGLGPIRKNKVVEVNAHPNIIGGKNINDFEPEK